MQKRIKLVNGKFGEEGSEPLEVVKKQPPPKKQYPQKVLELRDRVIRGNQKLFDAWMKIREIAHGTEEWSRQMDRWCEAQEKLSSLCSELKMWDYVDCLYINEKGEKTRSCLDNPDGFWCQVCSSEYPYWEEELMNLPSAVEKSK